MSEKKKAAEQNSEKNLADKNEIDDFARALLDRKAELTLFPDMDEDVTTSDLQKPMSLEQRRQAENTMLSALDQLRLSRGQMKIEDEEALFPPTPTENSDDQMAETEKNSEARSSVSKPTAPKKAEDLNPVRYEKSKREDHFEVQEQRPKGEKPPHKKKSILVLCLVGLVIVALFGGYTWKRTVYDPDHLVTEEQQSNYDRLVEYADEYNMASQAEQFELLDLESQYDSLNKTQKEQINAYFTDHTGKTVEELMQDLQSQKEAILADPTYGDLLNFAASYANLDDASKQDILNRIDTYNALSELQKANINSELYAQTGSDFMTLYNEQNAIYQQASNELQSSIQAQIDARNQELQTLQASRDQYASFLTSEGQSTDGNEILQEYDSKISSLSAEIQALQAQLQ